MKQETKHIQNWKAEVDDERADSDGNFWWTIYSAGGETKDAICVRGWMTEANARLIAAAPETAAERDRLKEINSELLVALEALLKSYDEETTGIFLHGEHAARVAIAKAKGQ